MSLLRDGVENPGPSHPIGPAEELQHISKLVIYPTSRFFKKVKEAILVLTDIKVSQAVEPALSPFTGSPLRRAVDQNISVLPLTVIEGWKP